MNPLTKFDIGVGFLGNALILFVIVILIFAGIGWLIWWRLNSKQYYIRIPLYKMVGNVPTRVRTFQARIFPIGKAGDYLWFVKGVKKFIAPATIQSAPNEYWHWERGDGEWINFSLSDLDESQKKAGVKYILQDMRSQRIATATILENRLINKSFWDQYKDLIIHLIFYIVVMVCMVVIFWQWSGITEQTSALVGKLDTVYKTCSGADNSLIPEGSAPAMILIAFGNIFRRRRHDK